MSMSVAIRMIGEACLQVVLDVVVVVVVVVVKRQLTQPPWF